MPQHEINYNISSMPDGISPEQELTTYYDDEDNPVTIDFETAFATAEGPDINYNISDDAISNIDYNIDSVPTKHKYNKGKKEDGWFLDNLPDFLKAGYNQSITGIAYQLAHGGQPVFENIPDDLNTLEDIMATVASFFMPVDLAAMALGGGVGGLSVRAAMTASATKAASALAKRKIQQGMSKRAAGAYANRMIERASRGGFMKATDVAMSGVTKGATTLGFYSGVGAAANQALAEGNVGEDYLHALSATGEKLGSPEAMRATLEGMVLGGVTGGTGAFLKRKGWRTSSRAGVEIAEFANLATLMEKGELAKPEDYTHAAGVIFGLKGVRSAGTFSKSSLKTGLTDGIRKFVPQNRFIIKGGEKRVDVLKWRTKDGKEFKNELEMESDDVLKSVYVRDPVKGTEWWSESTKFFSRYESAKGFIGRKIERFKEEAYQKSLGIPLNKEETRDKEDILVKVNKGISPPPGQFNRLMGYFEREQQTKLSERGFDESVLEYDSTIKKLFDYKQKLQKRQIPYNRGDIKKVNESIKSLKSQKQEVKNIIKVSDKLGISEYSPFDTAKIDISKKPPMVKVAMESQKKRKDLAESDAQWKKYRKDRFNKESLDDFSTEELAQYISYLRVGKKRRPKPAVEAKRRLAEFVRAKVLMDIENQSSYAKSIVTRTNESFKNNNKKPLKFWWRPTEEAVAGLGDNYAYGLYLDVLDVVKIADNRVHSSYVNTFGERAFKIMGNKDPNSYRSTKFTNQIIDYFLTGESVNPKVSKMAELIKEFDTSTNYMTRTARAFHYFRSSGSIKSKVLPIVPDADLKRAGISKETIRKDILSKNPKIKEKTLDTRVDRKSSALFMDKLEKDYSNILKYKDSDGASAEFMERMKNYTFGVKDIYFPIDYHRTTKDLVDNMLSVKKTGPPSGRLMRRKGEGVADPNKFWGWFDNKVYKDYMMIFGTPRVENFVSRLKELNPAHENSIKPFVQSLYRYSDYLSNSKFRALQTVSGLFYKSWLMSGYPSIRNLTQNVARSAWFPVENLDLFVKGFGKKSPKQKAFFNFHIDQRGGVDETHYLTSTAFKDAPLPIRKFESMVNYLSRHYSYSDKINRNVLMHWLMPLESHVRAFKSGRITDKQLFQRLKLEQSNDVVKQHMLNKLYNENIDTFMGEYIRQKMIDVHHLYTRYERPIFMQSEGLRPFTGLLTYSVSSLSKINREVRLLYNGIKNDMPNFGKRQLSQVILNQTGNLLARSLARGIAIWKGADIVSQLTEEEGNAYLNIKADDIYDTMQWMIPSTAANEMVRKITGKPGKYGLEEVIVGMPLQFGVAEKGTDTIRFLMDWANNPNSEPHFNRLINSIESIGTSMIPLLDAYLSSMSAWSGLLRGRLYDDFLPYWSGKAQKGENVEEQMRLMKLRFRKEMAQRYNYISSKEFDKVELMYRKFVQMPIIRGERSVNKLRRSAIDPFVQSIVLEDIASKVATFNKDEADKLLQLADELMKEYESKRKYVPQLPGPVQAERPYQPGAETFVREREALYK